jgi:hypothetical protein
VKEACSREKLDDSQFLNDNLIGMLMHWIVHKGVSFQMKDTHNFLTFLQYPQEGRCEFYVPLDCK